MFRHHPLACVVFSGLLLAAGGCDVSSGASPTAPAPVPAAVVEPETASSLESFLGVWRSEPVSPASASATAFVQPVSAVSSAAPELRACRNFHWAVSSQTTSSIAGTLAVECADGISLAADATGDLTSATALALNVAGTADLPAAAGCAFTLAGPAVLLDADTLQLNLTGTTCLGPVSADATLYRDKLFPPPPPPPAPEPPPPAEPPPPPPPPPPSIPCALGDGDALVSCIEREFPDRLAAGVSHDQRVANMAFLRDRIIEAGRCGGLDLAWNLKRGVGPHSIDALAWRHPNGFVDVVDIGAAYDDTSRPLGLMWQIVAGPPGYDPYPHPGCN